jgi:hypothetical protein
MSAETVSGYGDEARGKRGHLVNTTPKTNEQKTLSLSFGSKVSEFLASAVILTSGILPVQQLRDRDKPTRPPSPFGWFSPV